ncbi:MAG: HDOD domain-containing protein [Verrucomicrobiota bacterium]
MTTSSKSTIFELIADPKATQTLPSLRIIVDELAQMMGKTHTPIQAISGLIRRDQSMAVRILRLANSAYFAPSQPILNIEEALLYLGLNQIRSSILTARCIEQACTISDDLMSWKQFWNHSVATGCICRILSAKLMDITEHAEAFYVMGLLHDIGKLVLAYLSPQDFEKVLSKAKQRQCDTSSVEFDLLGIDHASLGAWYLQQQGLPSSVFEPVRLHHSWQVDSEKGLYACLIALADQFAHALRMGQSGSEYHPLPNPYHSPEWQFYAEHTLLGKGDALLNYVANELENLNLLVDQLVA